MARSYGLRGGVLALGVATTFTVACAGLAGLSQPSGDKGAGADSGPIRVRDSGIVDPMPEASVADSGSPEAEAGPMCPPGTLDPTFGAGTGVVTLNAVAPAFFGPHSIAVQPNGAIAYAGEYETTTQNLYATLAGRVLEDGGVDKSFNQVGHFTAEQNGYWDEVGWAMTLVPDAGMLLDGFVVPFTEGNHEMFAVSLTGAGQQNSMFGSGTGFVAIADDNVDAKAYSILLQPDGKILLGGFQGPSGAIERLNPDGSVDMSWGAGIPNDAGDAAATAGALPIAGLPAINRLGRQPQNGDILAAAGSGSEIMVAALLPNGTLDTSYGSNGNGVATLTLPAPLTGAPDFVDMVVLNDGEAVCFASTATTLDLVRFSPAGQVVGHTSVPSSLTASSIDVLPDGSFVVGVLDQENVIGVAHFTAQGVFDTSFGGTDSGANGIVMMSLPSNNSVAVAVDGSGRIVVGTGTDNGVVLARYCP